MQFAPDSLRRRSAVAVRALRFASLGVVAGLFATACNSDKVNVPITAASVDVSPHLASLTAGQTQQLTAQAKDENGNNIANDQVTWVSLDSNIAIVSASGLVTTLQSGATAIVATTRGASGFASIDVAGVVASVAVTGSAQVPIGQSTQLNAVALEANGRELFSPIVWASSAPTVATVSSTGLLTTVSVGTANITASSAGKVGSFTITVLPPPPVATVAFSPNSGFLPSTVGVPLATTLRDANGGLLNDRVVSWSTSAAGIATVSASGVVTGVSNGAVTITATSEGKSGSGTFTVLTGVQSGGAGIVFSNANENPDAPFVAFTQFAIYVPAGSTSLQVTLRGGTGDPDLYLYRPGNLNVNADDCHSFVTGPAETCTVSNPAAGVWRIIVDSYQAHSGTTIAATIAPTPP